MKENKDIILSIIVTLVGILFIILKPTEWWHPCSVICFLISMSLFSKAISLKVFLANAQSIMENNTLKISEEFNNLYEQISNKYQRILKLYRRKNIVSKIFRSSIANYIDSTLKYNEEGLITYETKYKNAFKVHNFENIKICENHISGRLQDYIFIDIMDMLFMYENSKDLTPIAGFYGTFAYITLDWKIKDRIDLKFDTGEDECKYADNTKILTDSVEFEKKFDLYCKDRNFALCIFTIDLIEEILYFLKESEIDFEMTITGNEIYFRFFSREILRTLNKYPSDKITLYQYYLILKFIKEITIKLNNKIKELE